MKTLALSLFLVVSAVAQNAKPFLGRWDITVTPATGNPYPQWLEVTEKDGKIEGRVQPRGGAWRTFTGATVENGHLIVRGSRGTRCRRPPGISPSRARADRRGEARR